MLKPLTKLDYRQLFCAALRSGKYKQVSGAFGWAPHEACAIGVGWKSGLFPAEFRPEETASLPIGAYDAAREKLGLAHGNGSGTLVSDIFHMNDNGKTFEEIATWVEEQPL